MSQWFVYASVRIIWVCVIKSFTYTTIVSNLNKNFIVVYDTLSLLLELRK